MTDFEEFEEWYRFNGQKTDPIHYSMAKKIWQARGRLDAERIAELTAKLDKAKEALKCIDEDLVNPVHYILVKEALEELDK